MSKSKSGSVASLVGSLVATGLLTGCQFIEQEPRVSDPHLWLENIEGAIALDWVREVNAQTERQLTQSSLYQSLYDEALAALNSESRIPLVTERGGYLYNLWKDVLQPRGLYRRTRLDAFREENVSWESVIDIDALSESEGQTWVLGSVQCLSPEYRHCMVELSPGGSDASEYREFDMETFEFVEGGFFIPLAKSSMSWIDENTLYVGTRFDDQALTDAGYPRIAKIWHRGTSLASAEAFMSTDRTSVGLTAQRIVTETDHFDLVIESRSFWSRNWYEYSQGEFHQLNIPSTSVVAGAYRDQLVIRLNEDWQFRNQEYLPGSVVVANPSVLAGAPGQVELLVAPTANEIVEDVEVGFGGIAVTTLESVRARLYVYTQVPAMNRWERTRIPFPDNGTINVIGADNTTGGFYARYESFTTPTSLYYVSAKMHSVGMGSEPELLKSQGPTFNGDEFRVDQFHAQSRDGTRIPYFVVRAKSSELDGQNPVHMFAYGGFRLSVTPSYSGTYEHLSGAYGKMWLERGGIFVLPNIRGGGEFGPAWHAAALRENRYKAFEDFEAVAEDLVHRGVTSAEKIGIEGRSNGGLLVTATMARRPELYGAVVAGVPLADMRRYHKLLAGASWMAEYGDPENPEDWAFISRYSPYQNLDAQAQYPPVFIYSSTRDDRVHPGHARKLMAKLLEQGHEAYYFENIEGGHGGSATNEQLAHRLALTYRFFWLTLTR